MLCKDVIKQVRQINRDKKRNPMFISLQHPKSGLDMTVDEERIKEILRLGWWGQKKINGFRCQTHITHKGEMTFYTRQGQKHTRTVSNEIKSVLENLIPANGINVFDAEWQFQQNKLYVFDMYRAEGQLLKLQTYAERYQTLRDEYAFIGPHVEFLPVYKNFRHCMQVLNKNDDKVEGLVFKYPNDPGWSNTGIMRCLKTKT